MSLYIYKWCLNLKNEIGKEFYRINIKRHKENKEREKKLEEEYQFIF
jgi:hypothetical protein